MLSNAERTDLILNDSKIYRAFIKLALPVCGANLLKAFHDLIDTYFIGQMPNSVDAQAGISIVWPMLNILMAFNVGLSIAGVAIISQLLGSRKKLQANEYSALLLTLSVIFGALINILIFVLASPIMKLMGATDEVFDCAVTYTKVRSFEMVFVFIFTSFQATRQAQGDTATPVMLSIISVVINIALTALFVKIMGMGVFGAALSTVIGNLAVAPICLYMLFFKKSEIRLEKSHFKFNKEYTKNLVRIATPSAGSQALSSLGFLVLQAFILSYGKEVSAAFSIGNKISNLMLIPVMAVGSVLAAFVGQNIGAGNKERAKKSYRVSLVVGIVISVVGCLIIFPFCDFFVAALSNDTATRSIAMEYMTYVLLIQPLMSVFQNYLSLYNGSGNTRYSFLLASTRLWIIRLPMIWIFKTFTSLGRSGIWYAMVISNFLILIVGELLYRRVDYEPKIIK